jgi:G3E family GTPase
MNAAGAPIPFSVIGGFLGAGKTTLLNRLLTQAGGVRYAVLVNDFGDLAIDGDLVRDHGGDTITFANGCLCCTLGDNMLLTLTDLLNRADPPEHIVVEASGIADPRPIADIATLHPGLEREPVVVLVDAETIMDRATDDRVGDTVAHQLAAADILVMNKCDLVSDEQRSQVRAWLATEVPDAAILETQRAELPRAFLTPLRTQHKDAPHEHHDHDHGAHFHSVFVGLEQPVDLAALRGTLEALPDSVLRAKGFVVPAGGSNQLHVVQLAGRRLSMEPWVVQDSAAEPPLGLMVIGTADMPSAEELEKRFSAMGG